MVFKHCASIWMFLQIHTPETVRWNRNENRNYKYTISIFWCIYFLSWALPSSQLKRWWYKKLVLPQKYSIGFGQFNFYQTSTADYIKPTTQPGRQHNLLLNFLDSLDTFYSCNNDRAELRLPYIVSLPKIRALYIKK